jgi:hypothetical protein
MANLRNKIYYPKSHIVTNLVTTGKEWMFEDGTEYIGYYHKYIEGLVMSGAVFKNGESKKLIPYIDQVIQPHNKIYNELRKHRPGLYPIVYRIAPQYRYPMPDENDYAEGFMTRYILRKRNYSSRSDIIEVDLDQFKLWRKRNFGIDETLYDGIEMQWKLTGPLNDIKDANGVIQVYGVYDTNMRMVQLKNNDYPGLADFLTDFTEVTIYSKITPQSIKDLYLMK